MHYIEIRCRGKKLFIYSLTKYVVGAKANPPKNPRRPPKKGNVIPTNIVKAAMT